MAHGAGGVGRFRRWTVMRGAAAVARGRRWHEGLIWGVQGGRGSAEQGVPWRRKPCGGERQWWCRGAVKGTGKGVEGAPDVGAELGAVLGGLEGGRAVVHSDSTTASMAAQWRQQAEGCAPFIATGGGWHMAARVAVGGGRAAVKLGVVEQQKLQLERHRHGRRRCSDRVADERVPHYFVFFLNYPNWFKFGNWKWMLYSAPKIRNSCMELY
jgi:hypothetical protein